MYAVIPIPCFAGTLSRPTHILSCLADDALQNVKAKSRYLASRAQSIVGGDLNQNFPNVSMKDEVSLAVIRSRLAVDQDQAAPAEVIQ